MLVDKPRCIFQIDGANGGVLNVAERLNDRQVMLVISNEQGETKIVLDEAAFSQLADLRYSLRFGSPQAVTTEPQLKVVNAN